jgi:hypothetical protein
MPREHTQAAGRHRNGSLVENLAQESKQGEQWGCREGGGARQAVTSAPPRLVRCLDVGRGGAPLCSVEGMGGVLREERDRWNCAWKVGDTPSGLNA